MPMSKKGFSASKPLACADSMMSQSASPSHGDKTGRMHKRSRSGKHASFIKRLRTKLTYLGCYTCRLRRKKCDERHPMCGACDKLNVQCNYKRPSWWTQVDQRREMKELIKNRIKQTKMQQRSSPHARMYRLEQYLPSPLLTNEIQTSQTHIALME